MKKLFVLDVMIFNALWCIGGTLDFESKRLSSILSGVV